MTTGCLGTGIEFGIIARSCPPPLLTHYPPTGPPKGMFSMTPSLKCCAVPIPDPITRRDVGSMTVALTKDLMKHRDLRLPALAPLRIVLPIMYVLSVTNSEI